MGLLTELLLLPLAPARGVTWIAERVREEAVRRRGGPANLEAELEELDRQRQEGELSEDEAMQREEALLRGHLDHDEEDEDG